MDESLIINALQFEVIVVVIFHVWSYTLSPLEIFFLVHTYTYTYTYLFTYFSYRFIWVNYKFPLFSSIMLLSSNRINWIFELKSIDRKKSLSIVNFCVCVCVCWSSVQVPIRNKKSLRVLEDMYMQKRQGYER